MSSTTLAGGSSSSSSFTAAGGQKRPRDSNASLFSALNAEPAAPFFAAAHAKKRKQAEKAEAKKIARSKTPAKKPAYACPAAENVAGSGEADDDAKFDDVIVIEDTQVDEPDDLIEDVEEEHEELSKGKGKRGKSSSYQALGAMSPSMLPASPPDLLAGCAYSSQQFEDYNPSCDGSHRNSEDAGESDGGNYTPMDLYQEAPLSQASMLHRYSSLERRREQAPSAMATRKSSSADTGKDVVGVGGIGLNVDAENTRTELAEGRNGTEHTARLTANTGIATLGEPSGMIGVSKQPETPAAPPPAPDAEISNPLACDLKSLNLVRAFPGQNAGATNTSDNAGASEGTGTKQLQTDAPEPHGTAHGQPLLVPLGQRLQGAVARPNTATTSQFSGGFNFFRNNPSTSDSAEPPANIRSFLFTPPACGNPVGVGTGAPTVSSSSNTKWAQPQSCSNMPPLRAPANKFPLASNGAVAGAGLGSVNNRSTACVPPGRVASGVNTISSSQTAAITATAVSSSSSNIPTGAISSGSTASSLLLKVPNVSSNTNVGLLVNNPMANYVPSGNFCFGNNPASTSRPAAATSPPSNQYAGFGSSGGGFGFGCGFQASKISANNMGGFVAGFGGTNWNSVSTGSSVPAPSGSVVTAFGGSSTTCFNGSTPAGFGSFPGKAQPFGFGSQAPCGLKKAQPSTTFSKIPGLGFGFGSSMSQTSGFGAPSPKPGP
ncbi:unnamed protein product [Amoebophrya sp. A25]|nr:unnamed protein product [Amoebophrya sp. A25]|eukprot:GSA25T00000060001.1